MTGRRSQHRAVVDTNLVVSSFLSRTGAPHAMIQAMYDRRFTPVFTENIFTEYAAVLNRRIFASKYGVDSFEVAAFLQILRDVGVVVPGTDGTESPVIVRDEQDQKFIDAAYGADADYLVTGDSDLLVLAGDPRLGRLRIVKPHEFLDVIHQE